MWFKYEELLDYKDVDNDDDDDDDDTVYQSVCCPHDQSST